MDHNKHFGVTFLRIGALQEVPQATYTIYLSATAHIKIISFGSDVTELWNAVIPL